MSEIVGENLEAKNEKKSKKESKPKEEKKKVETEKKKKEKKPKEEVKEYPVAFKDDLVQAQLTELKKIFADKIADNSFTPENAKALVDESFTKIPEAENDVKMYLVFNSLLSTEILKEWLRAS